MSVIGALRSCRIALVVERGGGVYRPIYAAFLTGRRINSVSLVAEAWFWRLHALADDYGNLQADPYIVKSLAAPRREMTAELVATLNAELITARLLIAYEVDGEPYYHIDGFEERQSPANGKRKQRFPKFQKNPEKSKQIQTNPVLPDQTRPDQTTTITSTSPDKSNAAGADGLRQWAEGMAKRPDWLPSGKPWIEKRVWIALGAEHPNMTQGEFDAIVKEARTSKTTLKNPAGFIIAKIQKLTEPSR